MALTYWTDESLFRNPVSKFRLPIRSQHDLNWYMKHQISSLKSQIYVPVWLWRNLYTHTVYNLCCNSIHNVWQDSDDSCCHQTINGNHNDSVNNVWIVCVWAVKHLQTKHLRETIRFDNEMLVTHFDKYVL